MAARTNPIPSVWARPQRDPAQVREAKFARGPKVVLDSLALRLPRKRDPR